jgi:hypothetical protein
MQRKWVTLAALSLTVVLALSSADAAERRSANEDSLDTGIVYGDGFSYFLTAPEGWVLDNTAGVDLGLHAVFYPRGSTWTASPAVMYANTVERDTVSQSLEAFIADVVQKTRAEAPTIRVRKVPALTTRDGKRAEIRVFTGDKRGNCDRVAFIPEGHIFVMVTLTSKTPHAYAQSTSAFDALVSSYQFFTEDVTVK